MATPLTPIALEDWFDPYDYEHIRAYRHLEQTGSWPEGFIPEMVTIRSDGIWHILIPAKMAQEWMKQMEKGLIKTWDKDD